MHPRSVWRHVFMWLAIVASTMGALAPPISQIVHSRSADDWAPPCHEAMHVHGVAHGPTESLSPAQRFLLHCPYCVLQLAGVVAPPVESVVALLCACLTFAAISCAFVSPRTRLVWSTAQSRGPPATA